MLNNQIVSLSSYKPVDSITIHSSDLDNTYVVMYPGKTLAAIVAEIANIFTTQEIDADDYITVKIANGSVFEFTNIDVLTLLIHNCLGID